MLRRRRRLAHVPFITAPVLGGAGEQREGATRVDHEAVAQALWAPRAAAVVVSPSRGEKVVNGRLIHGDGSGTLTYTLLERCDSAAAGLAEHFRASGWRQRRSQILMPRLRTSFTTGCERVPNGILSPEATTRGEQSPVALAWHGEWEDNKGNTLTYDVSSDSDRAQVHAAFLPVDVAVARGLRSRRVRQR